MKRKLIYTKRGLALAITMTFFLAINPLVAAAYDYDSIENYRINGGIVRNEGSAYAITSDSQRTGAIQLKAAIQNIVFANGVPISFETYWVFNRAEATVTGRGQAVGGNALHEANGYGQYIYFGTN